MRKSIVVIGLLICLTAMSGAVLAAEFMGEFTQQTLDGKMIKSETLKGRPAVIAIVAHW